jgi:cell division protein FtsI (penicillin-binding protein 3)
MNSTPAQRHDGEQAVPRACQHGVLSVVLFAMAIAVKLFTIQSWRVKKWRAKAETVSTTYRTCNPTAAISTARMVAAGHQCARVRCAHGHDAERLTEMSSFRPTSIPSHPHWLNLFGDRTAPEYKRDLTDARHRKERYHLVKRKRGPHASATAAHLPALRLGRYKGGLVTEKRTVRVHPFGRLASRSVGYVLRDSSTLGLEGGYDTWLKGVTGRRLERA